tara:strand:+ start:22 stop:2322 length:2301 start_codon:yes stop_codon:yes gene_type:complete
MNPKKISRSRLAAIFLIVVVLFGTMFNQGPFIEKGDLAEHEAVFHSYMASNKTSVDSMNSYDSSIIVDDQGDIHISYVSNSHSLHYAYYDGVAWTTNVVDNSERVGGYSSLAVGDDGSIHISYHDKENNDLKYAIHDGSGWTTQTIDDAVGGAGTYTSLAIDSLGNVHISYRASGIHCLKHAMYDQSTESWSVSIVTMDNSGEYSSLAIDSNDRLHISWYKNAGIDLKYAVYESGSWITSTVDEVGRVGQHSSLAVDSNGIPHISYYDDSNSNLKYATLNGSTWTQLTIDSGEDNVGTHSQIITDSSGNPHIVYFATGGNWQNAYGYLKHASFDGNNWTISILDNSSYNIGSYVSIDLDSNNRFHVSYRDNINGQLIHSIMADDSDNDMFGDDIDECPNVFGTSLIDRVGCLDSDSDGYSDPDGVWTIEDGADAFTYEISQWTDSDDDGYGDNQTGFNHDSCPSVVGNSTVDRFGCSDSDGDGISDDTETANGTNPNLKDTDSDGYDDAEDEFPLNPVDWYDSDEDGVGDNIDDFPLDGCATNDTDGDTHPDTTVAGCDTNLTADNDDDNDSVLDNNDAFPLDVSESIDTDLDGIGDNADTDDDGDGYSDVEDWAPLDSSEWLDSDGDGIGDTADEDDDNDGVSDEIETSYDNDSPCSSDPFDPNSTPSNNSAINSIPNFKSVYYEYGVCEIRVDSDGDGIIDWEDMCPDEFGEFGYESETPGCPSEVDGDSDSSLPWISFHSGLIVVFIALFVMKRKNVREDTIR